MPGGERLSYADLALVTVGDLSKRSLMIELGLVNPEDARTLKASAATSSRCATSASMKPLPRRSGLRGIRASRWRAIDVMVGAGCCALCRRWMK